MIVPLLTIFYKGNGFFSIIGVTMRFNFSKFLLLFLIIISSEIIFAQEFKYDNFLNYKHNYALNHSILFPDNHRTSQFNYIKTDSIISMSTSGSGTKLFFQYHQNGKISEYLITDENNINSTKFIRHYNNDNHLISELCLDWNPGWDSSFLINYYYSDELLTTDVFQIHSINGWEDLYRNTYKYYQSGNLEEIKGEIWANNQWINQDLFTYYYSNVDQTDSIWFRKWINDEWQDNRKTIFYYNGTYLDSLISYKYENSTWSNIIKRIVVNDLNHNQIEQVDQLWFAGDWQNDIRRFYSYDENNYITKASCELWNGSWQSGDGDILIFNPDDFRFGFLNANKVLAYYTDITSADDKTELTLNQYLLYQNYPNPFNPSTKITYEIPLSGNVEIKVFDVLGNEISTLVNEFKTSGKHEVLFSEENIPAGVYIYRIKSGSYLEARKMVLQK
jgi:hypothetical protein